MLFILHRTSTSLEHETASLSMQLRNSVFSQLENAARFLSPLNSSTSTLSNILTSSTPLNGTDHLSFNFIQQKVAPWLLAALSTIPYVSHASYVGEDGLMFSYNINPAGIFATFSNSSSSCYTQLVDGHSGELWGQGVRCGGREKGLVFVYDAVTLGGKGLISLAYPTQVVSDHFAHLALQNADLLHLATRDGRALVETKLNGATVHVRNGTVSVEAVDVNGRVEEKTGFYSCSKADGGELTRFCLKIRGSQHILYCSTLEIGGIQSVYVVSFPTESSAHKKRIKAFVLVIAFVVAVIVVTCIMITRAAQQELVLSADLANQMEAERKSMNKSVAFVSACHDIRTALVAISGLIDLCRATAKPEPELTSNLDQMSSCAMDLLGILNSILDTSKIEAGKMQLEEEEFNVAKLVEDVVDLFYPLSMKKGVDIVLDATDCSIFKHSVVKGDRAKLKQILCNLLSNATKFTSQGHISVRAKVSKRNQITRGEEDDGCMDYIFEVDDTGEGIPKEMRALVFDNFVQVKETALGQGTGLGLGIIRSLVHLMGGEIKIVDKDEGERGTCFRFNVVFTACQGTHTSNDGYPVGSFGMPLASRSDASHVILFLTGNERRKVTENLMRRLGLRVSIAKTISDIVNVLNVIDTLSESNNAASILIVLDANAASISDLSCVSGQGIHKLQCEIVWVENPMKPKESEVMDDENRIPASHHILSRPLHGSYLYRILQLLPEFRPSRNKEIHSLPEDCLVEHEATSVANEIEVVVVSENDQVGDNKALNGKNVLLVEDDRTLCMLATTILQKLGATLHVCKDGKEAFDLVCTTLKNKASIPFDYIFMDCKMPLMDGFEATRLIRKEEAAYGIHTPIIAVTAYFTPDEVNQAMDAGMDFHLLKPLTMQNVLNLHTELTTLRFIPHKIP
ncbi:hypothetical protein AAHA92_31143 [Salvia divinorum]|uniref:histidine kinase n=1 Tax=Salvia divinorum TaxID=28513 RepID=A0ABD1FVL7_SALDI